jgi:hypothetical protein
MEVNALQDVFNLQAFFMGCLVLIACVLIQTIFVLLVVSKFKSAISSFIKQDRNTAAHFVFTVGILLLLTSHLCQIYVWGLALNVYDVIPSLHQAMVYAGSTYTTVGFISDPLLTQWQLLSVIMAVSGLFAFGWSTAVVFMISQALFPAEKE